MTEPGPDDLVSALRAADGVLFVLDSDGVFTLSDGGGLAALGLSPGEVVGRSVFEVYATSSQILADVRRALAGESFTSMVEVQGSVFETRYTPCRNDSGDLTQVVGISTDITDVTQEARARMEMQDSLIESRQRFLDIAETAVGVIWEVDSEGRLTFISSRVSELVGRDAGELLGKKWSEVDWLEVDETGPILLRPAPAGPRDFHGVNATATHRDGRRLKFIANGRPFFSRTGELKGYRGSASDVSEFEDVMVMLESVSQGVSAHIGEDFMRRVLKQICRVTECDIAFVARLLVDEHRAQTVAVFADGAEGEAFEYDLRGTPCSVVGSSAETCIYPSDVARMFHEDYLLQEMSIEAYAGVPLISSAGKVIGLLVLLKRQPFDRPDLISTALSVFAGRVGAELERQLTEASLAESEVRYRDLFNSSADAYLVFDAGGTIVEANSFACALYGYESEEFVGVHGSSIVHPDYHHLFGEFASTKYGDWFEAISRDVRKDGSAFDVEVHGTPIILHDERHLLAIVRDVTARKAAEEALEESRRSMSTLLDNLQGMAYRCKPDSRWTMEFVSDGCIELTGYTPDDLLGNALVSYASLIEKEDAERVWKEIQEAIATRSPFSIEYRITDREGLSRWVWEKGQGIVDASGELLALEGFMTDMTERKELEEALDTRDHDVRRAYADVFHAATQGKLQFVTLAELEAELGERIGDDQELTEYSQLSHSRHVVRESIVKSFPCMDSTGEVILAYGEAVTNGIKHGGSCRVSIRASRPADGAEGKLLQVIVADRGHGIDFSDLPRATLTPGFSTKNSLGMGFSIMLEVCNKVLLSTDETGTTVMLIFDCDCAKTPAVDIVEKSTV